MSSEKIKANLKVGETVYPFLLRPEDEPYYREATKILGDRYADLKGKYSSGINAEKLVGVLALEALVDALMLNEKYIDLNKILTEKLDNLEERLVF